MFGEVLVMNYVAISFLFLAGGCFPYFVWVWSDGSVTLDFGCVVK